MRLFFLSLFLLLTLILSGYSPGVYAVSDGISQQKAVSIAQQVHPGRVLAVKRKANVYRVKTLSDRGEVRIVLVDATSGKVISGR